MNIQKKEREQKFFTYDRFHVWSINYDEEGKINAVMIVNQKNEIIYSMDARILDIDINKTGEKQETGTTVKKAEGKVENMAKQIPDKAENKALRGQEGKPKEMKTLPAGDKNSFGDTPALTKRQRTVLEKELERTGVALDAVLNRYHLESSEQISEEIYKKAIECLRKSKNKEVA